MLLPDTTKQFEYTFFITVIKVIWFLFLCSYSTGFRRKVNLFLFPIKMSSMSWKLFFTNFYYLTCIINYSNIFWIVNFEVIIEMIRIKSKIINNSLYNRSFVQWILNLNFTCGILLIDFFKTKILQSWIDW